MVKAEADTVFKHASAYGFVARMSRLLSTIAFGTIVVVVVKIVIVEVRVTREVEVDLPLRTFVLTLVDVVTVVTMVL